MAVNWLKPSLRNGRSVEKKDSQGDQLLLDRRFR
jgi:hypothetical protein